MFITFQRILTTWFLRPAQHLHNFFGIRATNIRSLLRHGFTRSRQSSFHLDIGPFRSHRRLFTFTTTSRIGLTSRSRINRFSLLSRRVNSQALIFLARNFTAQNRTFNNLVIRRGVRPVSRNSRNIRPNGVNRTLPNFITRNGHFNRQRQFKGTNKFSRRMVGSAILHRFTRLLRRILTRNTTSTTITRLRRFFFNTIRTSVTLRFTTISISFTRIISSRHSPRIFTVARCMVRRHTFTDTRGTQRSNRKRAVKRRMFLSN